MLMYRYNPERVIIGEWQETGWIYESVDKNNFLYRDIKLGRKHESESWRFMRNKKVQFFNGGDVSAEATWKLKGRGHILQITYEDGDEELYDIKELDDDRLEINFDIGMESRGIARLVFIRKQAKLSADAKDKL